MHPTCCLDMMIICANIFTFKEYKKLGVPCDLEANNMVVERDMLSWHDDNLCQFILKSHREQQSYESDTKSPIQTHNQTHNHTQTGATLYALPPLSWWGHKMLTVIELFWLSSQYKQPINLLKKIIHKFKSQSTQHLC